MPDEDVISETVNFEDKPAAEDALQATAPEPGDNALAGDAVAPADEANNPLSEDAPADASPLEGDDGTSEAATDATDKPKPKGSAWQKRVDQLTKEKHDERRAREAAESERDLYKRMAEGGERPETPDRSPDAPKPADAKPIPEYGTEEYQRAVRAEAERLAEQKTFEQRFSDWESTGIKDFPDFRDRCATLASLGATENAAFVPALLDIDNGAKVAAQLAENPDEASRILSLPPTRMISELTKMGIAVGKPKAKAVSKAPAPIKPVDGSAQVSDEVTADDSEEEMYRKWDAEDRKNRMKRYGHL